MSPLWSMCLGLLAVWLCCLSLVHADVPGDLIETLPGYGKTPSKQYSGLLPADDAKTVFLHYWFVTSTGNPATDPVAVWMNGGPGCSSLEGFLTELGPFMFTGERDDTGLPLMEDNPWAWTTVSSVIFLEQPVGVGFSYATNGSTTSDDFTQSQNTYGFLLSFFAAYPEFAKNEFFITGESYAGIYVPTLANRIVDGNAAGKPHINLKGIAVGDGCIGSQVGTCGDGGDSVQIEVDFLHGHSMISEGAYERINQLCGNFSNPPDGCYQATQDAINRAGNFDIYDVCGNDNAYRRSTLAETQSHLRAPNRLISKLADPVVCVPTVLSNDYLSSPVVQKAIHVDMVNVSQWTECWRIYYGGDSVKTLLPLYPKLIANMNVLIYSGDADACVPWNGSYNWTRNLGLEETVAWRPWMTGDGASRSWTAGFVTAWGSNFSFVTIKHAGHMVPAFEPEAALTFYTAFLKHTLP